MARRGSLEAMGVLSMLAGGIIGGVVGGPTGSIAAMKITQAST
jgi:hypothetical protein